MNRRLLAPAAAVLALGGFLAACGDDDMSRDEIIEKLVDEAGIPEEQAACLTDALGDDAESTLNDAADDPTGEAAQKVAAETADCMGLGGDLSIPDISMPDLGEISIPEMPDFSMPDVAGITLPELDIEE